MKKTTTTNVLIADQKAIDYICKMLPAQAKKVLYGMTLLQGDQRLGDSFIPEVRTIAHMYDGVINAKFAKELAAKLAKAYIAKYPKTLLTKKELSQYTDASYRKLLEAVGEYGFDYVLTVLRQGKAYVNNPANGVDEKSMLRAMRWVERREDKNQEESNKFHRKTGLKLVGFGDMAACLVDHSFIIASVYELVEASGNMQYQYAADPMTAVNDELEARGTEAVETKPMTVREMKIHFIQQAGLLMDYYGTKKPEVPEGYAADDLGEGSLTYKLAERGLLTESEAVLEYSRMLKAYEACEEAMAKEFSSAELEAIQQHSDFIQELIKGNW